MSSGETSDPPSYTVRQWRADVDTSSTIVRVLCCFTCVSVAMSAYAIRRIGAVQASIDDVNGIKDDIRATSDKLHRSLLERMGKLDWVTTVLVKKGWPNFAPSQVIGVIDERRRRQVTA